MEDSNGAYLDNKQKDKMNKFISDIGAYPKTWNVKEIILDCIKSEAYLSDVKRGFVIDDVSKARTYIVLEALGYDIKLLLKLQNELNERCAEKSHNEPPDYDDEEPGGYDNDACDNCGWPIGRNHDCNSSMEGSDSDDEEDVANLSVDNLIFMIVHKFESEKEEWVKKGFEIEDIEMHEIKEKEELELLYKSLDYKQNEKKI